jgi:V8-like Glu-specific endopeptidase
MWKGNGKCQRLNNGLIGYKIPTFKGQSGSPVYRQ